MIRFKKRLINKYTSFKQRDGMFKFTIVKYFKANSEMIILKINHTFLETLFMKLVCIACN